MKIEFLPNRLQSGAAALLLLKSAEINPRPMNSDVRATRWAGDSIEQVLAAIRFDRNGLVPAIAQQYDTREILMLAWMNREAILITLTEGRACYWSRSRGRLWRKGETSCQVQALHEMRLDCDGDTVLLLVDQLGVACHTGRRNCFFRAFHDGGWVIIAEPQIDPKTLYP